MERNGWIDGVRLNDDSIETISTFIFVQPAEGRNSAGTRRLCGVLSMGKRYSVSDFLWSEIGFGIADCCSGLSRIRGIRIGFLGGSLGGGAECLPPRKKHAEDGNPDLAQGGGVLGGVRALGERGNPHESENGKRRDHRAITTNNSVSVKPDDGAFWMRSCFMVVVGHLGFRN